jgi:hypothetical protein
MNKLLYLFLILVLGCSQGKNTSNSNDLTAELLKGNVKSVREIDYAVITRFDSIMKNHIGPSGTFLDKNRECEYNTSGMLIACVNYDNNNKIEGEYEYEYDEFGDLIKESIHRYQSLSYPDIPEQKTRTEIKYNNNRNKVEMTQYNYDSLKSKNTYKYDFKGYIIEQNEYFNDGSLSVKSIYEYLDGNNVRIIDYNSKGQITKEVTNDFDYNGKKIDVFTNYFWTNTRITYRYDKRGNVIEKNKFGENDTLIYKVESTYDLNGRIIFTIETFPGTNINYTNNKYDSKGSLIEQRASYEDERLIPTTYTNSFVYDKQQNWVKKISYRNFISEKITERKIIYY